MKTYLVTGGAGFIGSHIAENLIGKGHNVRILDNFLTGKRENIEPFLDAVDLFEGDIRDPEACRKAVEGADHVLHQAALASVPRSIEEPLRTNDINVTGTLNMLLAARDAGVTSFVQASSSSVYGDGPELPQREGTEGKTLSPYALSKRINEEYGRIFHDLYGMKTVSLRYFNVFGPRQDPSSQYAAVIPLFITKVLRGETPVIYGDGEQSRDFTYVGNVVEANILAAESERSGGRVLNIACGLPLTVNSLLEAVSAAVGTKVAPLRSAPRPGDIKHSYADISLAKEVLKFEPVVLFEEGLKRTLAWYRERS